MATGDSLADYVAIGRILAPHGVRGEIRVEIMTDFPERFAPGSQLLIEGESGRCTIVSARPHKGALLVLLDGYQDRTQIERLRGRHLLLPRGEAADLPEGEYYADELEGMTVVTTDARVLGRLVEVLWTGANEVYVVQGDYGEILLPAIAEVVQEVDVARQQMIVQLLPGLAPDLDEQPA